MDTLKQNKIRKIRVQLKKLKNKFNTTNLKDDWIFWRDLLRMIEHITSFVKEYKNYSCVWAVEELLGFLQIIAEKEELFSMVIDSPFRVIFSKITIENYDIPAWYIELCFKFISKYVTMSDSSLRGLLKLIYKSRSFSTQKMFIKIFVTNFKLEQLNNCLSDSNKELQELFLYISSATNKNDAIRTYLNKLNTRDDSPRIVSVETFTIKLNDAILVKNCWVDFNVLMKTITFECLRNYLSLEKNLSNFNEEFDTVTINMKYISNIRFKSGSTTDAEDELTLFLTEPCEAFFEASINFLEKYRTVKICVRNNKKRFKNFVYNLWNNKPQDTATLLPDNFEVNLLKSDEVGGGVLPVSTTISPTDTVVSSTVPNFCEEIINSQVFQRQTNMINDNNSAEANSGYVSDIMKTPNRTNIEIVVNDSQESQESVLTPGCSISDNISVAETNFSEISITSTQDSNSSNKVIDLTSPEIPIPVTNNEESSKEDAVIEENGHEHLVLSVEELETALQEPSYMNQENIEKNIRSKTFTTINMDRDIPEEAQEIRIGDVVQDQIEEPTKQLNSPNCTQKSLNSTQSSNDSKKRKKYKRRYNDNDDPSYTCNAPRKGRKHLRRRKTDAEDEFATDSFFSDAETSADYTYTRTRIIKKIVPFQINYHSDFEVRTSRKRHIQESIPEQLPKRIKTIMPVRRSSQNSPTQNGTETASASIEKRRHTIDTPLRISNSQRRLTNIDNMEHLEEQPTTPIFRLSVSESRNVPQFISESSRTQDTAAHSPKKTSPENIQSINETSRSPKGSQYSQENNPQPETNQTVNELDAHKKINGNVDQFDRMKYNLPSTQATVKRRNVKYFSSSSNSPDSGDQRNNYNRTPDFSDGICQVGPSGLQKTSPKTKNNKEQKFPKAANKKDKISVVDNKKVKRSPVKKTNDTAKSPKKGKKSKAADKNMLENVQDVSTELSAALQGISSLSAQDDRCELCGVERPQLNTDMQDAIKRICEIHLNSCCIHDRTKFWQEMEKVFRRKLVEN